MMRLEAAPAGNTSEVKPNMPEKPAQTPLEDVCAEIYVDIDDATVTGLNISAPDESVLLWGPPGAGKTTESGFRTAIRAVNEGLQPRDCTVVTYRTSLANTLRRKLVNWGVFESADLPPTDEANPYRFWGTSHAVACRASGFLDQFDGGDNTWSSEYEGMVDKKARYAFCDEYNISYIAAKPWIDTRGSTFFDLYTYAKQNLLDVGEYDLPEKRIRGGIAEDARAWRLLDTFRQQWGGGVELFHEIVISWEQWKSQQNCADYWEQLQAGILGPLPPLEHVVIDEIHDAYPLMALYFDRLVEHADTVIVAGDPDQVCNAFSGANRAIFQRLPDRAGREIPTVKLPKSYRCPDEHFAAAARVLAKEHTPPALSTDGTGNLLRDRPDTRMRYDERNGWRLPPIDEDSSPVQLWHEFGPDMMFLARAGIFIDGIGACFDYEGIVYESQIGNAGNWRARLALLRGLDTIQEYRPQKQASLTWTGENEYGRSETNPVETATKTVFTYDDAYRFVRHIDEQYLQDGRDEALRTVQEYRREEEPLSIAAFGDDIVTDEFWSVYGRGKDSLSELVLLNAREGFTGNRDRDVIAMARAWERYDAFDSVEDLADGLRLLTIHAAKGSEAPTVILYDGVTRRIAADIREHKDSARNEARTWYVGLTRAEDTLFVIRDAFVHIWEPYLDPDLEPVAAADAREKRAATDGGQVNGGDSA